MTGTQPAPPRSPQGGVRRPARTHTDPHAKKANTSSDPSCAGLCAKRIPHLSSFNFLNNPEMGAVVIPSDRGTCCSPERGGVLTRVIGVGDGGVRTKPGSGSESGLFLLKLKGSSGGTSGPPLRHSVSMKRNIWAPSFPSSPAAGVNTGE